MGHSGAANLEVAEVACAANDGAGVAESTANHGGVNVGAVDTRPCTPARARWPAAVGDIDVDVRLLRAVHEIVIPAIPCSFAWKMHPDNKQLTEMSDAWLLAHFTNLPGADGCSSSFTASHIIKSAFHMMATLAYATGISERMPPIIKLMGWFFLIDDILDDPSKRGADAQGSDKLVDSVLTVFCDTYVHPSPSSSPDLVQIFTETSAEWWTEMCKEMPPKQKARLSKSFCDYLEANRVQVRYRNSCHLPNVEDYFKMRSNSIGWLPCAVIIEHSQAFELDDEALSHPLLMALQENTLHQVILVNDITSFKKEYLQGDFCNIVFVLYFGKLYNPKRDACGWPTLQEAVLEALQMIKDIDNECVRLMRDIKNCKELMRKPGMVKYLEGLGLWMSGVIYWHLVSSRYGICATSDLHVTPPNLLAHHVVNLKVNLEVIDSFPLGIKTV